MSKLETVVCDVCGAQKREVNRWWRVAITLRNERKAHLGTFLVTPAEAGIEGDEIVDACGQTCVGKLVQRWMATGTLEETPPNKGIDR